MQFLLALVPISLSLFCVLGPASGAVDDTLPFELLVPITVSVLFGSICYLVALAMTRKAPSAMVSSSLFIFAFLSFHGFYAFLSPLLQRCGIVVPPNIAGIIYLAASALAMYLIVCQGQDYSKMAKPALIGALFLIPLSLAPFVYHEATTPRFSNTIFTEPLPQITSTKRPDIYYIVVDALAPEASLAFTYDYKDKSFVDFLRQKGFFVADNAVSNYDRTVLSFSSFLNLGYLDPILKVVPKESHDITPLFRLASDNRLFHMLRDAGYKIVNVRSSFTPTYDMQGATNVGSVFTDVLYVGLLQCSLVSAFEDQLHVLRSLVAHGKESAFTYMPEASKVPGPKLVFAHTLIVHPPFIFNADGTFKPLAPEVMSESDHDDAYLQQVIYAHGKLKQLVEYLLSMPGDKPIIIIHADHGPGKSRPHTTEKYINERLHIFEAIYLPNHVAVDADTQARTPVNAFRRVARHAFCDTTPYLPEHCNLAPDFDAYKAADVTKLVH